MSKFLDEVNRGLSGKVKKLNPKWLYDFSGSKLFEEITKLQEYYVTRTEIRILKQNKSEIANLIGKKAILISNIVHIICNIKYLFIINIYIYL